VPILALTNHPTPEGLAQYLLEQLEATDANAGIDASSGATASAGEDPKTTLVDLLGKAREEEKLDAYIETLAAASELRSSFDGPSNVELPRAVHLAEGPEPLTVVLLSSAGPMSGPHEYVKLAKQLDGFLTVRALPLLGFLDGEPLPASVDALTEVYAKAISEGDIGPRYALAGHSSGGWVAGALASHLEEIGAPPIATVLLDTYSPKSEVLRTVLPMVLEGIHDAVQEGSGMGDTRLSAMGGYSRIFAEWEPTAAGFPTVVIQADEQFGGASEGPASEWSDLDACDTVVSVPGNHFSMMDAHADTTARAIRDVIGNLAVSTDT